MCMLEHSWAEAIACRPWLGVRSTSRSHGCDGERLQQLPDGGGKNAACVHACMRRLLLDGGRVAGRQELVNTVCMCGAIL